MNSLQESVLIYGASGHAKVVVDIVELQEKYAIAGLLDDRRELWGQRVMGYPVLGGFDVLSQEQWKHCKLIIAVGDNAARKLLAEKAAAIGYQFATAVHPRAYIAPNAVVGPGTAILVNAVVNTGAKVGAHVIINTAATVDHDNVVEDFAHLSAGVHMGGGASVGSGALLGLGVSTVPDVRIGKWSIVGIGAAVIRDIPDFVTAVGVPAKPVKYHNSAEQPVEPKG